MPRPGFLNRGGKGVWFVMDELLRKHAPVSTSSGFARAAKAAFRRLRTPLAIATVGVLGLMAYGTWRYGSPSAAALAVRGYALAVSSTSNALASATAGDEVRVSFSVRNLRSVAVTIVGYRSTCRCSKVEGLPIVIPPGQNAPVRIGIRPAAGDTGKSLSSTVLLYLDVPSPPVVLGVSIDKVLAKVDDVANK